MNVRIMPTSKCCICLKDITLNDTLDMVVSHAGLLGMAHDVCADNKFKNEVKRQ